MRWISMWTLCRGKLNRAPFILDIPPVWMRYQSKLWRVSSVALRLNVNRFLWVSACCINRAVSSLFDLPIRSYVYCENLSLSLLLPSSICLLLLLNYLWKMCNQTTPSPQPTSSLGDTVRPLMSENRNSCSHKSPGPRERVKQCLLGNVVLFPLYICIFDSLTWNRLSLVCICQNPSTWGNCGMGRVWSQRQTERLREGARGNW